MAQRIIHYIMGEKLLEQGVHHPDRFRIGNLLPDAYTGMQYRRRTHFVHQEEVDGKTVRVCDFPAFHDAFSSLIQKDDLYLGYYMHLVEDAFSRVFWKKEPFHIPPGAQGVALLHRDYHLLNRYFVESRGLKFDLSLPQKFEEEPIRQIYPFDLSGFLKEFEQDFHDPAEGTCTFLSEEMMEEMLAESEPVIQHAFHLMKEENRPLNPTDFVW